MTGQFNQIEQNKAHEKHLIEKNNRDLQEKQKEIDRLKLELLQPNNAIEQVQQEDLKLKEKISKLQNQIEAIQQQNILVIKEKQKLQDDISNKQNEIKALKVQKAQPVSPIESIQLPDIKPEMLPKLVEQLNHQIEDLKNKNNEALEAQQHLNSQLENVKSLHQAEKDLLNNQVSRKDEEIKEKILENEALKQSLEKQKALLQKAVSLEDFEAQKKESELNKQKLEKKVAEIRAKEEITDLTKEKNDFEDKLVICQIELKDNIGKLEKLGLKYKDMGKSNDKLVKPPEEIVKPPQGESPNSPEVQKNQPKHIWKGKTLQAEIDQLKEELKNKKDEYDELKKEFDTNEKFQLKFQHLQKTFKEEKDKFDEKLNEWKIEENKAHGLKTDNDHLKRAIKDQKTIITNWENAYRRLKDEWYGISAIIGKKGQAIIQENENLRPEKRRTLTQLQLTLDAIPTIATLIEGAFIGVDNIRENEE